ncbi:hypothetical protein MJO28_016707 [Puccinia striiformis f. sp. tritici]|uniref:EH domain-containing protein n=2 Tax=Puccinia striiformis TaxID=27350 RepID=A0A2S4UTH9_9BASI|nr:hypothetical protein MJO28_016707 [Puccinia striiformis f. sp. tritici]POW00578.1 hypothetical protein PSTT_13041 [Puccinia striiformis]
MTTNQSINQLISFYNNQEQQQPAIKDSEDCYQINLQQWLSLGQPQETTQKQQQRAINNRRSFSRPPPPIPPRRHKKTNSLIIPTPTNQTEEVQQKNLSTIPLGPFRKSIQSLWVTLIRLHFLQIHSFYHDNINNQKIILPGHVIRSVWIKSGLDLNTLSDIWDSIDKEKRGGLNFEEFLLGMYEITKVREKRGLWTRPSESGSTESKKKNVSDDRMTSTTTTTTGRRTPPLIPSGSRSGSICSSSASSCSLLDDPIDILLLPTPHHLHPFSHLLHKNIHHPRDHAQHSALLPHNNPNPNHLF